MKIIKRLTAAEWFLLFMVVNNPPGGANKLEKEEEKRRRPLIRIIIAGANIKLPNINFLSKDGNDLELSGENYIILLDCMEKTLVPTMMDGEGLLKLKDKVLAAESKKSA